MVRNVPEEKQRAFDALIKKVRHLATRQPGYIVGETLHIDGDFTKNVVMATWRSLEDWQAWYRCRDRIEIQKQIDDLLKIPTRYEIYESGI